MNNEEFQYRQIGDQLLVSNMMANLDPDEIMDFTARYLVTVSDFPVAVRDGHCF